MMPSRRSLTCLVLGDETAPSSSFRQCGDGIAVDGEVCLSVERKATTIGGGVFLPGDFDGDGARDYYVDGEGFSGRHWVLREGRHTWDVVHRGEFVDEDGLDHAVYRASARDIDDDGFTDLLALMQYEYWSYDVGSIAFGGFLLRTRPGYQFEYELPLFWEFDKEFEDDPSRRFDGAFGDFDGDGDRAGVRDQLAPRVCLPREARGAAGAIV